jgi:hypothetical protein
MAYEGHTHALRPFVTHDAMCDVAQTEALGFDMRARFAAVRNNLFQ